MDYVFITVLNMSITASCAFVVVLLLRLILQRIGAPSWVICLLWVVVFFRLLCPVAHTSPYSLLQFLPQQVQSASFGPQMAYITPNIYVQQMSPSIAQTGDAVEPQTAELTALATTESGMVVAPAAFLPMIWFFGVLLFAAYSAWRWYTLRQRVATATRVEGNIYESDQIDSPFVMGLLRPKIYLPLGLTDLAKFYIVPHEENHIRRGDLWWKAIAQVALMLHWFNPLVYGAYALLGQDLERACDERVVARFGSVSKADYSRTLLAMTVARRQLLTPLAFCESKTKQRVQHILQYVKPTAGILLVCAAVTWMTAVACMSDPIAPSMAEALYQQESRQSVFYQCDYLDMQPDLQAIYQIVLPDDPLRLQPMISYIPNGVVHFLVNGDRITMMRDPQERKGVFHFRTDDYEQFQRQRPQMEQYMRVVMALLQVEEAGATVIYARDETTDISDDIIHAPTGLRLEDAPQGQAELERYLVAWGVEAADQRAAQLWPYAEKLRSRERLMRAVQEAFPFYDMLSIGSLSYSFSLPEQDAYQVAFTVNERDTYLREREKTRLDYEKAAILLFAQYPNLQHVEFDILGLAMQWGVVYRNESLYFSRVQLEQQCGRLAFAGDNAVAEQAQPWFAKVEAKEIAEPYGQPQMAFSEKLRRLEWCYDQEKTDAHYAQKEDYFNLRFSLLPEAFPADDGCYLQMEFVKPYAEEKAAQSMASLWIYGQQAQWQTLAAPTIEEIETDDYHTARVVRCSGTYRIVVSRWDRKLRQALEEIGGAVAAEQTAPWSVVYQGRLDFEQTL